MQINLYLLLMLNYMIVDVYSLVCYSCTASLSPAVDENAQMAMRIFLESTYFLPPVHRYCALEDDIEFKTVPTSQCSNSDKCIKISAHGKGQGLQFVIRGCESQIYKPNIGVHDVGCRSKESPSLCYCSENLCNNSNQLYRISLSLLSLSFLAILMSF